MGKEVTTEGCDFLPGQVGLRPVERFEGSWSCPTLKPLFSASSQGTSGSLWHLAEETGGLPGRPLLPCGSYSVCPTVFDVLGAGG